MGVEHWKVNTLQGQMVPGKRYEKLFVVHNMNFAFIYILPT